MSKSYQHEIPKARVNITLDVETGGSGQRKELPLKMLTIGDFSGGKGTGALQNRERISINKTNFDKVLADFSPEVNLEVANKLNEKGGDMNIKLQFNSIKDFDPESIAKQVPEMKQMIAMRNILKDLKANLLDNTKFRRELETIFKDNPSLANLREELTRLATDEQV
jgi:type VI secretion system protein ImpB